ncbi:Ppx/GppA phosphatase [Desulfacinum hydrothermale DSM 13146]|uniref:Ppx/GppA phosphatase n=1 Tax=Desulfacinum hydrothermale DSM 13146 TaxID=1121390 RepID=A0A1W1XM71_9BACT|nr:hypothetical protein [Desulfacinum hydrothermale]SMC24917.1 Ppx/GppA phosphatase [Desulfacinum hydrothermale DSM 13146]
MLVNPKAAALSGPCHAALDVGSHTIRVLVAQVPEPGVLVPLINERHIARLAKGFSESRGLSPEAMAQGQAILQDVGERLSRLQPGTLRSGATGVVRKAANGQDFLDRVAEATGLRIPILTEQEEALLSLRGMLGVLHRPTGPVLAFDLGGSSTEFGLIQPGTSSPCWTTSLFMGAAVLTHQFLAKAPACPAALEQARLHVRRLLDPVRHVVRSMTGEGSPRDPSMPSPILVGTAGTVTTLAAMALEMSQYVPYRINNRKLSSRWVSRTVARLAAMDLAERRGIPGLEAGREDIILGGALIVDEILAALGASELVVTDAGLLEGLLLDGISGRDVPSGEGVDALTWEFKWD